MAVGVFVRVGVTVNVGVTGVAVIVGFIVSVGETLMIGEGVLPSILDCPQPADNIITSIKPNEGRIFRVFMMIYPIDENSGESFTSAGSARDFAKHPRRHATAGP
jgi:hypothetical protein